MGNVQSRGKVFSNQYRFVFRGESKNKAMPMASEELEAVTWVYSEAVAPIEVQGRSPWSGDKENFLSTHAFITVRMQVFRTFNKMHKCFYNMRVYNRQVIPRLLQKVQCPIRLKLIALFSKQGQVGTAQIQSSSCVCYDQLVFSRFRESGPYEIDVEEL